MSAPQLEPKTIYVGNINYNTTDEELNKFFATYGKVAAVRILKGRFHGNLVSRGMAFVEFEDAATLEKVIKDDEEKLAKKESLSLGGRKLFIRQARPRAERKRDAAFAGGIPEGTTVDDLKNAFKEYNVVDAKIIKTDYETRRGFAFVKFATTQDQEKAVKNTGKLQLNGKESIVRFARRDYDAPRRMTRRFRRRRNFRRATKPNPQKENK